MVGWHQGLNGHKFEQTLGDCERQGRLTCCSPWGVRVGHDLVTEQQQEMVRNVGSNITADGDCSHESKRHLLLGRKAMINLDSILKSRDITLPTKIQI